MEQTWETAPQKACKDFKVWIQNKIIWQVLSFFVPGIATVSATLLIPSTTNVTLVALYGFSGGCVALGLLYCLVYLAMLIRAPYKQRDEVRAKLLESQTPNEKIVIRNKLDEYWRTGYYLVFKSLEEPKADLDKHIRSWISEVSAYIKDSMGQDYVSTFLNMANLSEYEIGLSQTTKNKPKIRLLLSCMSHIQDFLNELRKM